MVGMRFVVVHLVYSYPANAPAQSIWERSRDFADEAEARRYILNINPFSDRFVVEPEVVS